MMRYSRTIVLLLISASLLSGCGEPAPYRKPTAKVTGKLVVDGKEPGSPIKMECVALSEKDADPAHYSMSLTVTDPDGSFEISTYSSGDGVPDGEYALTFFWGRFNVVSRSWVGPDQLNGRYSDAKKSEIKFKVAGEPVDLGEINLTTK